jgi:hypothetical protein
MNGSMSRLEIDIKFVNGHADVWRLFDDAARLRAVAEALVEPFRGEATKVAGIESRGFILGTAAALLRRPRPRAALPARWDRADAC